MDNQSIYRNEIRPYTSGIMENEENIATIVVLYDTQKSKSNIKPAQTQKNFLEDFSSYVSTINIAKSAFETRTDTFERVTSDVVTFYGENSVDNLGSTYFGVFNNFSLTGVQEQKADIVKIAQNFSGSWNAFFMGEQPKMYSFRGHFLDTKNYPYYQEFMMAYDKFLSGRNSINSGIKIQFLYDGKMIEGYLLQISTTGDAQAPNIKMFNFVVLVKSENWLRVNYIQTGYREGETGTTQVGQFGEVLNGLSNVNRFLAPPVNNNGQ